jgi:hypothetical protein
VKNLLIVSLASFALVGCGKGRSNNPFRALATAKKAPELQGTYEGSCIANRKGRVTNVLKGNFDSSTYPASERTQISFKGDAATIKEIHYTGTNCDGGESYAFTEKGSFKVGDKDNNEKNNAGRYLDIQMKSVEASVLSEQGAKYANTYGLCGHTDWKAGDSAKDVTAQAGDDKCYDVTPQRTIANVYQVDNETLALGYTGDKAVSSEQRPTSIDSKNTFRKK